VETSAGVILPDAYIAALAEAAHEVGALMVLDCIASGCAWVDMRATGVDVLISAPQKGWSAQPCAGLVMMSDRATARMAETTSNSFAAISRNGPGIMAAYEAAGMPITRPCPPMRCACSATRWLETSDYGFDKLKEAQWALGNGVRAMLAEKGLVSVAAEGYGAPGVVVCYTDRPGDQIGREIRGPWHADRRRCAVARR
jgi:aspartate aminotransferase-like enzyme